MCDDETIRDFNESQTKEEDRRFFKINNIYNEICHDIDELKMENLTPHEIVTDIINYRISALTNRISQHLSNDEKDKIYDILGEIKQYNRIKNKL